MPLAVAVALAVPVGLMDAGLPLMDADAPLAGEVNVTSPPATGSLGLLAVTVTTNGSEKAWDTSVDWPLPEVTAMVKPWLSKAPMSTAPDAAKSALVGGWGARCRCSRRRWPGCRAGGPSSAVGPP